MSNLTLAEELILLVYNDEGSAELGNPGRDHGLGGALLMELALAGRVDVLDRKVTVLDPIPTGQPLLDAALAQIQQEGRPRSPTDWINRLGSGLTERVLDGLVDAGVLRRESDRVLWVIPRTRYPSPYGVEPPVETGIRRHLDAAIALDGPVEPRVAALCGLIKAVGLERKVFRDQPRDRVKERLATITEGDWASKATKRAIEETQAVLTAVTTATMIATTANT